MSENPKMFNRIASRYDIMNRIISVGLDRGWREAAIKELTLDCGELYLDVGCGTSDLTVEIIQSCPKSSVVGIDPSKNMIKIGKQKTLNKNLKQSISFCTGDAESLPFKNNIFDGAILGFVIRNVIDRKRALEEICRVLKPQGKLVILELGIPTNRLVYLGYKAYTKTIVPLAARIWAEPNAYNYLLRSVEAFPQPEMFIQTIDKAGFKHIEYRPLTLGTVNIFSAEKS